MSAESTPRWRLEDKLSRLPLRVFVPGHLSSIAPVLQSLMDAVRDTHFGAGREFELETVLREAIANAVVHGCNNDPSKVVECALSSSESGRVSIVVGDPGPGFDPESVPNPVEADNVYSTHGRGIYLIKQFVDDVWFERGGSEIHMVLKQVNGSAGGEREVEGADV